MATVSEYLNILIGFDVPKLKAEAGKVNKELSETDKKANDLMKSFGKAKNAAVGFFATLAGTGAISAFIANIVGADAALNRLSKTTGMSVENISAWSNAAEHMGGSASEMQAGIAGISKEMTKFKYTGDSTLVPFLNQMGVNILDNNGKMKDQTQIMLELADQAQKMPKEDFSNLASMNGFNQSQINLMLQGRKALEKQIAEQNKNNLVTKQQAEEAAKAEAAWADLKQSFMGVARAVAYVLIPPLIGVAKVLTAMFTFVGNHKETLGVLFLFAIPKLLAFNKGFLVLLRAMVAISPTLKLATFAMRGFGLTSLIALAPLLLIGTALGLLLDDFMTFQAGGDSLIPWGNIFGGAKEAINDIKDLVMSLGNLKDLLMALATGDWNAAKRIGGEIIENLTPTAIANRIAKKDTPAQGDIQAPQQNIPASQQNSEVSEQAVANAGNQIGENVASVIDFKKLSNRLTNYAHAKSLGKCAAYVREALEAGGADMNGHPINAGEYHTKGFLKKKGWEEQGKDSYKPQAGDVVVFPGQGKHKIGHIATYNGSQWISDFKQKNMAVWRNIKNPEYHVYRAGANTAMKKGFKSVRNVRSAPVNNNMVSASEKLGLNIGKSGNVLKLSEQDIIDLKKVTSTEVLGSLKGEAFEKQVQGVVDTILNRTASGQYGKNLREVINQRKAFSDINTNRRSAYGSVQAVPMSRVSKRLNDYIDNYLQQRASGKSSSVGRDVMYANPYFLDEASADTVRWVREVEAQAKQTGHIYGRGNAVHVHGTPVKERHRMPKSDVGVMLPNGFSSKDIAEGTGQVPYITPPMGAKAHHALKNSGGSTHNTINSNTSIHTVNIVADKAEQAGKAFLQEMQKARELKNPWWKAAMANNTAMQ